VQSAQAAGSRTAIAPEPFSTLGFAANLTHGWQFTPTEDITVQALGWADPEGDGFATSHEVGLFRADNTTPLVTAVVTSSSRLTNGFRYEDVAATPLSAGVTYIVAGFDASGGPDRYYTVPVANTAIDPAISYEGYVANLDDTGLLKPTGTPVQEVACCARWSVNFEFDAGVATGPWTGGLATPPHPSFPATGSAVTTTVLADGSVGPAVFNYDNAPAGSSGASGSWEFHTTALTSGTVNLDYVYSGFHAFFNVRASLEVFVTSDGVTTFTSLVNAGPADCCATPSNGFNYKGSTTLNVLAGDEFGFRMAGSNFDSNASLLGTLTVSVDAVDVLSPSPDVNANEDDPTIAVDLANTFSPAAGLVLDYSIDNPDLFASDSLTGTTLNLTPAANDNGTAVITVDAAAPGRAPAQDSFTVTINPINDPPVSLGPMPDLDLLLGEPNLFLDLSTQFSDVDLDFEGDTLTYGASTGTPGVVTPDIAGSILEIEGIGVGSTTVTVSATDAAGDVASETFLVTTTDPEFFGTAVIVQAVTSVELGLTAITILVTGEPGATMQSLQLLTSSSCTDGELGGDAVVFAEVDIVTFDENGEAFFTILVSTPDGIGTYASAQIQGAFSTGDPAACKVAGPDNDSWVRALELEPGVNGEVSTANVTGFLDSAGNSRWYRFQIQPGSRVTVDLLGLPEDFDLFLFKDIASAFQELEGDADVDGLNRLSAEFAPSTFAPSTFAPSTFAPSTFAPEAYAPSQFAPSTFAPSVFAPSTFAPSTFAPSTFSPSTFAPSTFAPSTFAPSTFAPSTFAPSTFAPSTFAAENFVNAQIRSIIGVSAKTGTGSERVIADTWNNTGEFYIRVSGKNGAFSVETPFELEVTIDGVDCTGVEPDFETVAADAGDYRSIILWDSGRVAADPENTPSEVAELNSNLQALAARPEVNGVILDLATFSTIQDLQAQAASFTSCPYAANLTAEAIKGVIDEYRAQNPNMEYVVLVGNDGHIPFYRYPDQGLLGPEQDYEPPVADDTQSQSALRLNYILGQDQYGAAGTLSLRDGIFPLPGLAVGRLVETAAEMSAVIEAYLATDAGVIPAPESTLVTGYDFLTDAALEVQAELEAGTIAVRNDTLITAADISPADPLSWTADDLRRELLDEGEDIVFLAGHFSANSALAADYQTTTLTTELAAATTEFTNAIIFSAGCHSGYNIVNDDVVPDVTEPLDWPQVFAGKGATLIAGTGYQYGDTDFVEYSERLYVGFSRQLRTGLGPVSVGQALVQAKQEYLETTPDIRGLHRKSVLISTIFGLPMLSVDMPGERIVEPAPPPTITPVLVSDNPGQVLGLQVADIDFLFDTSNDGELVERTVELTNLEGGTIPATYYEGADGVVTNPAEPALPLFTRDVTAAGPALSLRGVGLRSGTWRESMLLPLTGAPTTELRGVHTPFTSQVFFPMRLANTNYFDALTGGGTTLLHVTPAQHRVEEVGDFDAILRRFDALGFRLYYSDNTREYPTDPPSPEPNRPALAGPPTMSGVQAVIDGVDILFLANVVGDPSAGIHEVWVTYTEGDASSGNWTSLDLVQDPEDSTLWSGRITNGINLFNRLEFLVQAANGTGLVTINDNYGAYFTVVGQLGDVGEDGQPIDQFDTEMSLVAPSSGTYGQNVTVTATLSSGQLPVVDVGVVVTIGSSGRAARTDINGDVTLDIPLSVTPGEYGVVASFAGNDEFGPSSAQQAITVTRTGTELTLSVGAELVGVEGIEPGVSATLKDEAGNPLLQRTVYFTLLGGPDGVVTIPVITNNIGEAILGLVQLPVGNYDLTARFLGSIPTASGLLELDDPTYEASQDSTLLQLDGNPDCLPDPWPPAGGDDDDDDDDWEEDEDDDDGPKLRIEGFCYLADDFDHRIIIRDGTLIVGNDVRLKKKVEQLGEGSVIVQPTARLKHKITESGPGDVIVYGTVDKKIEEKDAGGIQLNAGGFIGGNTDESGPGSVNIGGLVDGNVTEEDEGDLVITPTGEVDGHAREYGEGSLFNDGWVKKKATED
jgi:hypothetical protein